MSKSLRTVRLPPIPSGPIKGEALRTILQQWQVDVLALLDVRNDASGFASGILADSETGNVTLGTQALPSGRTVGVPTLFTYIGDAGRAASQRFLWPITAANRNSVQSADTILTASSGATTSTVAIASHSVKFDFDTIPYSSGSITGLVPETLYYIYADDPNFDGGTITYYSTSNPDNLIAQGRYYVGYVTTPIAGNDGDISAATNANPVEFTTASAHGWSSGQSVIFSGFTDTNWTAFNSTTKVITVTGLDKYTVAVDTTTYGSYTSGATSTRVSTSVNTGGGAGGGVGGNRWDYYVP